jgi:NAD(P)-dependent dehydrogenase (short-subunit alcohol dehydrogenase family)
MAALENKSIIVTGAGGGLGRAMTLALCEAGANVAAVEAVPSSLDALAQAHRGLGASRGRLLPVVADLRDPAKCQSVVGESLSKFGRLDGLVNNAGIGQATIRKDYYVNAIKFWEVPEDKWRAILDTNVTAGFLLARSAVPHMLKAGRGRIVNVTTSMDTMIRKGFAPYGVSKAALESCSAIWAKDLEGTGITVNVLVPGGPTNTGLVPTESSPDRAAMIQPEVMQKPIVWLMSDDADGFTGRRLAGLAWNAALPGRQAAEQASAPAAWPGVGQQAVWPSTIGR